MTDHGHRAAALCAAAVLAWPGTGMAEEGGLAAIVADIFDNATYEAEAVLSVFPRAGHQAESRGIEDEPVEGWTHLGLDSTTFLGDDWSFGLGVDAVASTYRGAERGAFCPPGCRSGNGRFVDLSRLSVTYLGETAEVLVGKDDVPVGVAEIYSPADLYGRANLANPQHEVEFGAWQMRVDVYVGADRLSGIILPVAENAPGPADHARWSGGSGSGASEFANIDIPGLPPGVTADIQDDLRGSAPSEWGYLLQYDGTATGVDYFATAYTGPGPYPVLRAPRPGRINPYYKVRPRVSIASAGAAWTSGALKLYGEGMGYWAAGGADDDLSRVLVGAKYRETIIANRLGLDEITPIIEHTKEWVHDEQDNGRYALSSREARPSRNNLLLSLTVQIDSEWKVGGGYNRSLTDRDALTSVFVRYQPNDNLWLAVSGAEYHGRDDTMFGRFSRYDNVEFQVNYSF